MNFFVRKKEKDPEFKNLQRLKELAFEEIKALIADVEKDGRKSLNTKELIFLKKNIELLYKYKEFDCPWGP